MRRHRYFCGLVLMTMLLPAVTIAQDAPSDTLVCRSFPFHAPLRVQMEPAYDVLHADLSADVADNGVLVGRAALDVRLNVDTEALYFAHSGASVDSILLGPISLPFETTSVDSLRLVLPDTISAATHMRVVFHYRSRLQQRAAGIVHAIDPFQAWYPASTNPHDRFTSNLRISVPAEWTVAASGIPTGQRSAESDRLIFEFSSPHELPARRIGFAAGRVEYDTRFAALPRGRRPALTWWMPRELRSDRPRDPAATMPHVADKMAFISNWTGVDFPFERYTQLHLEGDPVSSSSLGLVPSLVEPDDRTATLYVPPSDLTRPLIQQWFGSFVSAASWEDVWLEESFPAYLDLFSDESGGPREDDLLMLRDDYLREGAERRPLVWQRWNHPSELVDVQTTARGVWVLHMLRRFVGEEVFRQAVSRFLADHAFERVTSSDWLAAVEAAFDEDVSAFADTWIYAGGHPMLAVTYTYDAGSLRVRVEQLQSGEHVPGAYPLHLDFEVGTLGDVERFEVRMEERIETYELPASGQPRYLAVDPSAHWLLETRVEQPASAWVAQLRFATTPSARLAAARVLGDAPMDPALLLGLRAALDTEEDALVRSAIVKAIGSHRRTSAVERALIGAYEDPSPRVRRAVLNALADATATPAAAQLALRAAETDVHYDVQAEAVRTIARIGASNAVDVARAALVTPSHDDVIRAAGLAALAELAEQAERVAHEEASRYASEEHPRRLRLAAVNLLGRLAIGSPVALSRLVDLMGDADSAVVMAAVDALETSGHGSEVDAHLEDIARSSLRARIRSARACL